MAASRRFRWGFVAIAAVAALLVVWAVAGHPKPARAAKAQAVPVAVAAVTARDLPLSITAIGAAQAWRTVLIRPQVSGKLQSIAYREGSFVKQGQLLAQIDPAPFNAALMQAQGALARDQALLQNARNDLVRYQTLLAQDSVARQTADTQAALVKQDEGVVMIDQGQVANARINLGYTRISAPVSGRVGVKLVDAATGTAQLKARFDNAGQKLWPGQFLNVKLTLQTLRNAITVPAAAVNQGPKGPYAYVVGADHRAALRPVTVETIQGPTAVIRTGLSPGETVVTDGQMSLKPGSQVAVRDPNAKVGGRRQDKAGKKARDA